MHKLLDHLLLGALKEKKILILNDDVARNGQMSN